MKTSQPRRPRRSASEWASLVEKSQASPLPLSDFCKESDVSLSQLCHWRSKLRAATASSGEGFTPIRLREPVQEPAEPPTGSIEVRLQNGRVVRVVGAVDTQVLRTVILMAEGGMSC